MALNDKEMAVVLKLIADQFKSELRSAGVGVDSLLSKFNDWKAGAIAAGGALLAIAKATANAGDEALKTSQKVGLTVEKYTALQHAAKLSNIETGQFTQSLGFLSKNLADAAGGSDEAKAKFDVLGISVRDADGKLKATDATLLELADRFARMEDGPAKAALAMELFGRSGKDLIPLLNQGRAGIEALMAEAERLGVIWRETDAQAAEAFNDNLTRLEASLAGLRNKIGVEVIPVLNDFVVILTDLATGPAGSAAMTFFKGLEGAFILLTSAMTRTVAAIAAVKEGLSTGEFRRAFEEFKAINAEIDQATEERLRSVFEGPAPKVKPAGPALLKEAAPVIPDKSKEKEALKRLREDYQLYIEGLTKMGEEEMKKQETQGRMIVEHEVFLFRFKEKQRQQEREDAIKLEQARLTALEAGNASQRELITQRIRVLEAQRDRELSLTDLTEQEKLAIHLKYGALIQQENDKAADSFLAGWQNAMKKYVRDTESMFGLGVDIARRTAQGMDNAFQQFFFNALERGVFRASDLLNSFLTLANQITSQILSGFLTQQGMGLLAGFGAGGGIPAGATAAAARGAANPGLFGPGFQQGGAFVVPGTGGADSQQVAFRATPGERVTIETPEQQRERERGAGEQVIELTIVNEVRLPNQGGGLTAGDVVNIIDANMRNAGAIRKTIRRGAR